MVDFLSLALPCSNIDCYSSKRILLFACTCTLQLLYNMHRLLLYEDVFKSKTSTPRIRHIMNVKPCWKDANKKSCNILSY